MDICKRAVFSYFHILFNEKIPISPTMTWKQTMKEIMELPSNSPSIALNIIVIKIREFASKYSIPS